MPTGTARAGADGLRVGGVMIALSRERLVPTTQPARDRFGVLALALFGFLGPQGHAAFKLGLLMLFIATLVQGRRFFRDLVADPFFLSWSVLSAYIVVRAMTAPVDVPQWEPAIELLGTGYFALLVAWWLRADTGRALLLLGAAATGLCVEILVELDLKEFMAVLDGRGGRRVIGSVLVTGMAAGIGLLGILSFLPRFVNFSSGLPRRTRFGLYAVCLLVVCVLLLVQVITRSRSVIGLLLVLLPVVLLVQFLVLSKTAAMRRLLLRFTVPFVLLFVAMLAITGPRLIDKLERGYERVVPYVLQDDLANMPKSSVGWRVHLTVHGANLVGQRPWFGWGPGTNGAEDLVGQYGNADLGHLAHLHDTYLEILVRLGVAGFLLYTLAAWVLLRGAVRSWRSGMMPGDLAVFLASSGFMVAAWSVVDFRLLVWDFRFPAVMLAALALAFRAQFHRGRDAGPFGNREWRSDMTRSRADVQRDGT